MNCSLVQKDPKILAKGFDRDVEMLKQLVSY